MVQEWVLCSACHCHVRPDEPQCPHCGAGFASAGATQRPLRRRFDARRLLCASALVGVGLPGCAGKTLNEDVQGTCDPTLSVSSNQVAVRCDGINSNGAQCACGSGGVCKDGACVSCECAVDQTCNPDGTCTAIGNYWFGSPPSTANTCYGSPPLLA